MPAYRESTLPTEARPHIEPVPESAAGLRVAVHNVSKRFGERRVLDGIDLDVAPGQFVAIVGRSGCGKSTLLRLLAGIDAGSGGGVLLDGQPPDLARDDVRMMFQDSRLLPWRTVIENIAIGLDGSTEEVRARATAALHQVGLADRADDWPNRLSGGQRQRIALARALVHRPRLLLLDEPLGALDALTRLEMQRLIVDIWRQHRFTALLVTHDVTEAVALGDRVVLIEDGRATMDQEVALARPREHGQAGLAQLERRILERLIDVPASIDRELHSAKLVAFAEECKFVLTGATDRPKAAYRDD